MSGVSDSRPLLLALDLDGTLVEPRKPVRAVALRAVQRALAAGVKVTLVTGRMVVAAKPLADQIGLDGPIVCYQGAVVADARSGRIERETPLPNAVALRIYRVAKAAGLHVQFYRDDRFYVEALNKFAELYARTAGTQPVIVPSLPEAFAGRDSTKVNIVTDPERTPAVFELMKATVGLDAYVTRSNPEFVEMLSPLVDKGKALHDVARQLGVPLDRIVAVGDSYNDLPLLRAAAFRIAMGSAPEELKSEADAIVGDVEHDGVAEAIERYVLSYPAQDAMREIVK